MVNEEEELEEPEEEPEEERGPSDLAGYGRRAFDIGRKRFGKKAGGAGGKAAKGAGKAAGKAAAAGAGKAAGTAAGTAAGGAVGGPLGAAIGAAAGAIASKIAEKVGPKVLKWAFYILLFIFVISLGFAIAFLGVVGGGEYFGSSVHVQSSAASQNKLLALLGNEAGLRKAILEDTDTVIKELEKLKVGAQGDADIINLIDQTKALLEELKVTSDVQKARSDKIDKIIANIKTIAIKLDWPTDTPNDAGFVQYVPKYCAKRQSSTDTQWGRPELIYFINRVSKDWCSKHSDIPLSVNDLSRATEGSFSPHKDHAWGVSVDLNSPTNKIEKDSALAQEFIDILKKNKASKVIFGMDLTGVDIVDPKDHSDHFHVEIATTKKTASIFRNSLKTLAQTKTDSASSDNPLYNGKTLDAEGDDPVDEAQLETPLSKLFKTTKTLDLFKSIDPQNQKIIMSEKDVEAISQGRIDERLLKTLIYLVTPKEQGGANFERLKIQRLVKGYATEKRSLSKETEYKDESDANISAHFKGQAFDISEIDKIRFKKVTKKKAFGVTYSKKEQELPSVPIRLVWQSEKGKGEGLPGFYGQTANELFGNLSLGALKEALGDQLEYNLASLMGENFPEWAKWLGVIALFEDFDLPPEGFEEEADMNTMIKNVGRATIAQSLGIEMEAVKGDSREELILNIGKSYLEKKLQIEQGSLTGDSLDDIFKNAGRRKLEAQLGLKKGSLDGNLKEKLKKIREKAKWKNYKTNQAKDEALDMPTGSAERIEAADESGLALIGAGVLVYALAVDNKTDIYNQIRSKQPVNFDLKINEAGLRVDVDTDILKKVASSDRNKRVEALKSIGEATINALSLHPDLSLGLTQKDWEKVKQGKMKISDFAMTVGARKYENEFDLPTNALYYTVKSGKPGDFLINVGRAAYEAEGENPKKYTDEQKKQKGKEVLKQATAKELNKDFGLSGTYEITDQDIIDLFTGKWETFAQKIGGKQIDQAMYFPENGTMDIVTGKKTSALVFQESGAIRLGKMLGLNGSVSIEGNIKLNYGQAMVEETLGLKKGSFSGTITEVKNKNADRFDAIFTNPTQSDALLGLKPGTTKDLLDGKISTADYNNKVADRALLSVTLDKAANYFGLEGGYRPSPEDFNRMLSTLQNWDKAKPEEKAAALSTLERISGRSWDAAMGFEAGTVESIAANPAAAPDILLNQGMKKLNTAFGFEKPVIVLHYQEGVGLDAKIDKKALKDWSVPKIKEITGIEEDEDAKTFLNGNIKDGFVYWGLASMSKEANQYLSEDSRISYDQAKNAYFGNAELEQAKIDEALSQLPPGATPEQKESAAQETRKQVRGELRKDFEYRIYDGFLRKTDPNIPIGFAKAMFEGTPEQKTVMMEAYAINLITKGQIPVTPTQIGALNNYLTSKTPENFDTLRESGIFSTLDNFLTQKNIFGIPILSGFSEGLFTAVETGNYGKLTSIYKDWATSQVFSFADNAFGLPAGTSYQIYQRYQSYQNALSAYQAALKAGDATKIAQAKQNLKNAQDLGIALVVHLVAGKQLAGIDEMLGLAPGTTENLLLYAVTGNPVFLAVALLSNFLTSSVEVWGEKPVCERQTTGQSTKVIFSGLFGKFKGDGEWEKLTGDPQKDFPFYQRHARCSVKRMLGSLLDMPEKTGDKNQRAIQMLTLRKEDVNFYAQKIYALYGKTQFQRGLRGIMSSDLFWQYIHVGY